LDFAQARYYKSAHGRFTTTDPILLIKERLLDPQQINLYAYCRNNPLAFIDPTGETIDFADTKAGRRAKKEFESYESFLEKNKDKKGFSELIATVQGLKDSKVTYEITLGGAYKEGVEGNTTSNGERVFVNIATEGDERYSQNSRFAHELEHARQFDNGELTFLGNDKGQYSPSPSSYDIGDEVKAFRAQLIASSPQDFFGKGGTFLRNFQNAKTDDKQADVVAQVGDNYQKIRSRGFDTNPRFDSSSGYKPGQLVRPTKENGYFFGRVRTVFERKK
jgi:RHS repeat-associated protein